MAMFLINIQVACVGIVLIGISFSSIAETIAGREANGVVGERTVSVFGQGESIGLRDKSEPQPPPPKPQPKPPPKPKIK